MKKILGIAIAMAIALVGFSVMAEETAKAPIKTDADKKAEEVCKAKNLTGKAYDDCLKVEIEKTKTTATATTPTTTTTATAKTPTTTTTTAPATK
ncbi:MAG: hypothetical protein WC683_11560 [bacterium]